MTCLMTFFNYAFSTARFAFLLLLIFSNVADAAPIIPSINVEVGTADNPQEVSTTL